MIKKFMLHFQVKKKVQKRLLLMTPEILVAFNCRLNVAVSVIHSILFCMKIFNVATTQLKIFNLTMLRENTLNKYLPNKTDYTPLNYSTLLLFQLLERPRERLRIRGGARTALEKLVDPRCHDPGRPRV